MNNTNTSFFPAWKQDRPGWIAWGILCILALFALLAHEPWFDEIQAWQIAKTADWYDILFRIPHFEGHPPAWHLCLALFAKAAITWQWVLRPIGFVCIASMGFLVIFKSPFPRWVRIILPFSYFLFLQYGVIVRPYGPMMVLMILLAMAFPSKDARPGRFILLLAALAACHLFGLALAGGITLAWLLEIKNGQTWRSFLRYLCTDKRFHYMLGLLGWAILILAWVWPYPNTAADAPYHASILLNLLYLIVAQPADAFLTNYNQVFHIKELLHTFPALLIPLLLGATLWYYLLTLLPRKQVKYLVCPYILLLSLMILYSSRHHQGIIFLLILWNMWLALQAPTYTYPRYSRFTAVFGKALLVLCLLIPVGWTINHLVIDAILPEFNGPQAVTFLTEHDLLHKRIFATWSYTRQGNKISAQNIHNQGWSLRMSLYTPHNIIANYHDGGPKRYNSIEKVDGDAQTAWNRWREGGLPDILLGNVPLDIIWQTPGLEAQYIPVFELYTYNIWKFNTPTQLFLPVYVRRDLLEKHHLHRIDTHNLEETNA